MKNEIKNQWIPINVKLPEHGIECLFYNEKWISDDFNPKGIRIGFIDDLMGYVSAYWCNYHDEYHTRTSDEDSEQFEDCLATNQIPTHWIELPKFKIERV